jgi:hypothetical protein
MDIFFHFLLFFVSLQKIHNHYDFHCNAINEFDNDTKNMIVESIMVTSIGKILKWIKFNAIRQKNMIQGSFRSEFEEYSVCLHY